MKEAVAGRELRAREAALLSLLVLTSVKLKSGPDKDRLGCEDSSGNENCSVEEVAIVELIGCDVVSGGEIIVTKG